MADDVFVKLAVLETKLDGIQETLNIKFTNIEKRVDEIDHDLREKITHEKGNVALKFDALERSLSAKANASDLAALTAVVNTKADGLTQKVVFGLVGLILSGFAAALVKLVIAT